MAIPAIPATDFVWVPARGRIEVGLWSVMNKQPDDDREVLSITDVPESHTDEMHRRMVKYSLAMGIRLACLLLFFFIDGWARWLFVAGAVFLPWIAVVIANGGSDQSNLKHSDALLDHAPAGELESAEAAAKAAEPVVVPGEIVDEEQEAGTAAGTSAPGEGPERATGTETVHRRAGPAAPVHESYEVFEGNLSPVTKRRKDESAA
jgi:hypothetical protein